MGIAAKDLTKRLVAGSDRNVSQDSGGGLKEDAVAVRKWIS